MSALWVNFKEKLSKNLNSFFARHFATHELKLPFHEGLKKREFIKSIRDKKPINANFQGEKEQKVLKVSMFSALVLAIFGVGFGIFSKSLAVIFDGFVCLVSVGLGALSVITSHYIYKEDDELFQFGYLRFEPMVNLFKSLVLVLVCVYAFINALSSLLRGGYSVDFGAVAVYSVVAFFFCLLLFLYTKRASSKLESDLIKVDKIEWRMDCVLYAAGIVAFSLVFFSSFYLSKNSVNFNENSLALQKNSQENFSENLQIILNKNSQNFKEKNEVNLNEDSLKKSNENFENLKENFTENFGLKKQTSQDILYKKVNEKQSKFLLKISQFIDSFSHYIDPFLLALLSILLCVSPLKIAIANLKDLLMLAPPELDDKITQIMQDLSAKHGFKDYDTHVAKLGRFFVVEVNVLVSEDFRALAKDMDGVRNEIENALALPSYKIWLSVSFTANKKWL